MSRKRLITDFPRNEPGLVDNFLGTSYDVVKEVYLNLENLKEILEAIRNLSKYVDKKVEITVNEKFDSTIELINSQVVLLEKARKSAIEDLIKRKEILKEEMYLAYLEHLQILDNAIEEAKSSIKYYMESRANPTKGLAYTGNSNTSFSPNSAKSELNVQDNASPISLNCIKDKCDILLVPSESYPPSGDWTKTSEPLVSITPSTSNSLLNRLPVVNSTPITDTVISITYFVKEDAGRKYLYYRNSGNSDGSNRIHIAANSYLNDSDLMAGVRGEVAVFISGSIGKFPRVITEGVTNVTLEIKSSISKALLYVNGEYKGEVGLASKTFPPSQVYTYGYIANSPTFSGEGLQIAYLLQSDLLTPFDCYRVFKSIPSCVALKELDTLTNESYEVATIDNNKLITVASKGENIQGNPASLIKIMVAMVLLDFVHEREINIYNYYLTRDSTVSSSGSGNNLLVGDMINLSDSISNLLLPSSNVTANMIAREFGKLLLIEEGNENPTNAEKVTRWMKALNDKSQEIGMKDTLWVTPSGLGLDAKTTSKDVVTMLINATNYKEILSRWNQSTHVMDILYKDLEEIKHKEVEITSTVFPVVDGNSIGGKSGTMAEYGYNMAFISYGKNGRLFFVCSLGSTTNLNRIQDVNKLIKNIKEVF